MSSSIFVNLPPSDSVSVFCCLCTLLVCLCRSLSGLVSGSLSLRTHLVLSSLLPFLFLQAQPEQQVQPSSLEGGVVHPPSLSCWLPSRPLTIALRPAPLRASLLGLGLAAPGFHSDGCLETKCHVCRSLTESWRIELLSINQDRKRGRLWAASSLKRREEETTVSAFWNLGSPWGERNCSSVALKSKREPSPLWALLRGMCLQGAGFGSLF